MLTLRTLKFGVVTTSRWRSQVRAFEDPQAQAEIDWNEWNPMGFTYFAVVVVCSSSRGVCLRPRPM